MPRSSQIHQNRPLENISLLFKPEGFIADSLSPRAMVRNESNTFYVYDKDTMSIPETLRADGAVSNRATFNLSTASYLLEEHALNDIVTRRQRNNADKAIKLDIDVTEDLTRKIMLRRELDLADLVTTAANWANTTSLTAGAAWNLDTILSSPITQIDSAASTILLNCGRDPNVVAIDDLSFKAAKEHQSIVDRVKHTSPESITDKMIATLFNVGELLVSKAVRSTAEEGIATTTMARLWTDTAFIGYVEKSPGLRKPSAMYTFWQQQGGVPFRVNKFHDGERDGDVIEVSAMFDNNIVASDCGFLVVNTVQ